MIPPVSTCGCTIWMITEKYVGSLFGSILVACKGYAEVKTTNLLLEHKNGAPLGISLDWKDYTRSWKDPRKILGSSENPRKVGSLYLHLEMKMGHHKVLHCYPFCKIEAQWWIKIYFCPLQYSFIAVPAFCFELPESHIYVLIVHQYLDGLWRNYGWFTNTWSGYQWRFLYV